MTAQQLANQLRRVVDALEKTPDAAIYHSYISIDAGTDRESFMAVAKHWPKPFEKETMYAGTESEQLALVHGASRLIIKRSAYCTLITPAVPAVYDCPPILTLEDEAAIEAEGKSNTEKRKL